MRRISKRQQANHTYFRQQVERFLESLGAVRNDLASYPYNLPTCLGMLGIHPYDTWVASRWEDVPRALEAIGPERMNRYSGKWNHHYDTRMFDSRRSAQLAVEDFCSQLRMFLLSEDQGSNRPAAETDALSQVKTPPRAGRAVAIKAAAV